jgi:ATP-dependent helicase HrpA
LKIWQDGCKKYEMKRVHPESLPNLPLELDLGNIAGLPVKAWPGLEAGKDGVSLKLFTERSSALRSTREGFRELCEESIGKDFGWMQRDLMKEVKRVGLGFAFMMDSKTLAQESYSMLKATLLECDECLPLDPARMKDVTNRAKERMRGLVPKYVDLLQGILDGREKVLSKTQEGSPWRIELDALIHSRFLRQLDLSRLNHYARYLEALSRRIDRARQNPSKDAEKAKPLIACIRRYAALKKVSPREKWQLRWLLEEYKVQIFAQELGTDGKVSAKVIDAAFARLER